MLDASIVRVHQHARGQKGAAIPSHRTITRRLTSKIHAVVDGLGNPLRFDLNKQDKTLPTVKKGSKTPKKVKRKEHKSKPKDSFLKVGPKQCSVQEIIECEVTKLHKARNACKRYDSPLIFKCETNTRKNPFY